MRIKNRYGILMLLFISISFSLKTFGQIIVDVGNDTTYCSDPNTTEIPMGLKVDIQNGIEPFRFAWECKIVPYGILGTKTASDILNDSTLISPTLTKGVWFYTDIIKFILYITDNAGNLGKDSIQIAFSNCGWVLGYQVVELNKGDSVFLNAGAPHGSVASYYWTPREGLSNPDSSATWCKPSVSTDYSIVRVDTSGCACANHVYEIRVIPTSSEYLMSNTESKIMPYQKGSKVYFNNTTHQEVLISIYSSDGKLLRKCSSSDDNFEVSQILKEKGTYIVKISLDGKIGVCKYLKY